jgi:hypothetical protein
LKKGKNMALQKQTKRIQNKIGTTKMERWDSVVGIATGYRLDDQGVGVGIPVGARILIHQSTIPGLGPTQPPI